MGNSCSGKCVICYIMCLTFPFGTCFFCRNKSELGNSSTSSAAGDQDADPKISVDEILQAYTNLSVLHSPSSMCTLLVGTYNPSTTTCTVNLDHADEFLAHVSGIDSPAQLCGVFQGELRGNECSIGLERCGQAALEVKMGACSAMGGAWVGGTEACKFLE